MATTKPRLQPTMLPDPEAIVRAYPDPRELLRAYIDSNFARSLALEHERLVEEVTARGPEVTDADSYQEVGERLVEIVRHRRTVEDWFHPLRDLAFKVHRLICERQQAILAPLTTFEATAKANRLRLERAEAEARRLEEQRLTEVAHQAERERLAREAADLEARGEELLAKLVLEEAVSAPAPVVILPSTLPANRAISSRANYGWRPVGGDQRRGESTRHQARAARVPDARRSQAHRVRQGARAQWQGAGNRVLRCGIGVGADVVKA